MTRRRVLLSWSSGKDSAYSLHVLRQQGEVEVVGLLTTQNEAAQRVAMHGVRRELLELQAAAAELPLWIVDLPWPCTNDDYARRMGAVIERARTERIDAIAYGDLFLEDIRAYRLERHAGTGIDALFPLWGRETLQLARTMIADGLRARLACIDSRKLPLGFAGREFDADLLADLPAGVDPCGEHGEFHTLVWDGPMFRSPIRVRMGEVVDRDGFVFTDFTLDVPR